jgi:uncharacterized protein (TIGR00297 family)
MTRDGFARGHKVNTMELGLRVLIGSVLAAVIALVAFRARSLSPSGAIAAAVVGTVAVAAGWDWAVILIAYFVSSTLLSRMGRRRKLDHTAGMIEKPGARDAWQVLSNGLPFTLAAGAAIGSGRPEMLMAAGAGSLAASAADTWATEIGTFVGQTPRSILTGRRVAVGESGGVTLFGSLATVAGAAFIAVAVCLLGWPALLWPVTIAGIVGSVIDSVAGATMQRRSWCDACDTATEMRIHTCGARTRHLGGIPFVENDAVNLMATIAGAVTAALLLARSL